MGKRKASKKSRKREGPATKVLLIEKGATAKDTTKKGISKIKKEPAEEVIPEPEEEESEGKQITGKRTTSKKSRKKKVTATKVPLIEKDVTVKDTVKKGISKIKKEPVEEVTPKPEPEEEESAGKQIMGKRKTSKKSRKRKVTATKVPLIGKDATAKDTTRKGISKTKKEPMEEESEEIQKPMNKEISGIKQEQVAQFEGIKQELEEKVKINKQRISEEEIAVITELMRAWRLFRRKNTSRRRRKKRNTPNNAAKKKGAAEPTIRIGHLYQAGVPKECKFDSDERDPDELLWEPNVLSEEEVNEFLAKIQKEEWKGMDEGKLLTLLQRCNYDTDKALKEYKNMRYIPKTWTEKECRLFEEGLDKYGKKFFSIQQMIQTKTCQEVAEFYYVWKKTERYDMFMNSKPPKGISKFRTNNWKKMSRLTDIADDLLEKMDGPSQKTAHVYCTRSMFPVNISF